MKITLAILAFLASICGAQAQSDALSFPANASYVLPGGRIALHGSRSVAPLVEALDAKFIEMHPGFKFATELKGSDTAMPALAAGATPIAFVVGEATQADRRAFHAIHKHDPVSVRIGYAGHGPRPGATMPPAVYVHSTNPLRGLTMAQLAGIFTSGSKAGDINSWSQLNVGGAWEARRIHVYGPRDDGAFSTTLRLTRLGGMPFIGHYEPLADDAAVVQAVASDPFGIGLVDWLPSTQSSGAIKIVPLASDTDKPFATPDRANVGKGAYPLTPFITLYFDHAPSQPIEPFVKAYLAMVLSDEGQTILLRFADSQKGFLPLSPDDLGREREKLKD
jgi:phosphate transport system substrate-binding protein